MDVVEDAVEPSGRTFRAGPAALALAVVVGLAVGALLGRAWQQREAGTEADATVRLAAVLVFARVQIDPVHAGEDVKLFGQLVNAGPRPLDLAPGASPRSLELDATRLDPGATTSFTAEEPLVCEGGGVTEAPVLRVRATGPDGATTQVALPLAGEAWESLRLECLQRTF